MPYDDLTVVNRPPITMPMSFFTALVNSADFPDWSAYLTISQAQLDTFIKMTRGQTSGACTVNASATARFNSQAVPDHDPPFPAPEASGEVSHGMDNIDFFWSKTVFFDEFGAPEDGFYGGTLLFLQDIPYDAPMGDPVTFHQLNITFLTDWTTKEVKVWLPGPFGRLVEIPFTNVLGDPTSGVVFLQFGTYGPPDPIYAFPFPFMATVFGLSIPCVAHCDAYTTDEVLAASLTIS